MIHLLLFLCFCLCHAQDAGRLVIAVQSLVTKAEIEVVQELTGALDIVVQRASDVTVRKMDPYVRVIVLGSGGEDLSSDRTDVGVFSNGEATWPAPSNHCCRYDDFLCPRMRCCPISAPARFTLLLIDWWMELLTD
jgi:hypothetical protein